MKFSLDEFVLPRQYPSLPTMDLFGLVSPDFGQRGYGSFLGNFGLKKMNKKRIGGVHVRIIILYGRIY